MQTIAEVVAAGLNHHLAGRLNEAEQLYRQALAVEPNQVDALHLLGLVALQMGSSQLAVALIGRAVELNGAEPVFHSNLGNAYQALGKIDNAVECYRRSLQLQPDAAEVLSNLGVAYLALGKRDEAIECFLKALGLKPDHPETHYNLAGAFKDQGKLDDAASCYRRALELKPDYAEAYGNLGTVYHALEKWNEALDSYGKAMALKPDLVEAISNSGICHQAMGKFDEAVGCYQRAIKRWPNYAVAHNNLGTAWQALDKFEAAIECYGRALQLQPGYAEAHYHLGNAWSEQGMLEEAIACYRNALHIQPDHAKAYNNLGSALQKQGKLDEAIACCRRSLELKPGNALAHNNLGNAFKDEGRLAEAVACYRRAVELKPDLAEAHYNLGAAFRQLGQYDDELASYARALELKPEFADAHANRATLWLMQGDFQRGWPELEWRWKTNQRIGRTLLQIRWDGSPLMDRTILLYAEQGFGDTIQFIRYATLVKQQNPAATVIVQCQRPLVPLLARCPGIDRLIADGDALPPFDVQSPLLSLPGIFGTTVDSNPANVPYLFADPVLVGQWREKISHLSGLKVGIHWHSQSGQPGVHDRNVPLKFFAQLAELPGICLVSLQKGSAHSELAAMSERNLPIVDLGDDFDTAHGAFMDTAAVMMNLDLVISSDTAVPHLAGALGVPVWLAEPFVPDWRWLQGRQDSPWYPKMRIFRQQAPGDWAGVFHEIRSELALNRGHAL